MRKIYRPTDRAALLAAVKRGEPVPVAARRLEVEISTAYRWVREAGGSMSVEPEARATFIELMTATDGSASRLLVRVGTAEIEVRAGFDPELLRAVVAALGGGS